MELFARLTKLIFGLSAALVGLTVLLIITLLFLDLSVLRDQLESSAAGAFGRRVIFEGSIRLKPSLRPTFLAEDFRIGNPDWASRPDLAQVERLEVQVALLPLLRGQLEVLDVTFWGVDVLFEVGPENRNNFTFRRREGPPELPAIDRFRVQDSVIGYRTAGGELHSCAVIKARARNMRHQPVKLEGQVVCRDVPMRFSLTGGTPEQFASSTVPWPLALSISTEDTSFVAQGSLPGSGNWDQAEFQVYIEGEKVDSLDALFDVDLPVHRPFELSAKLTRSQVTYSISDLKGHIGSTDIAGQLQWEKTGGRPYLTGQIGSQVLHIEDFVETPDPNSPDKKKPGFLDRPIPLDWIAAIDGELELDVKHVIGSPVSIDNTSLTAKLGDSQLTLSPLRVTLADIPLKGDLAIALQEDAPAIGLAAETQQLDLAKMLEQLTARVPLRGNAENVTVTGNSRGRTLRTLLQQADLSIKARGGRITSVDAEAKKPWALEIAAAEIEARKDQPINITMDGKHRAIPLSLVLNTVTLRNLVAGIRPWPLAFTVSTEDASFDAKGSVSALDTWDEAEFQVAVQGEKIDSLNALFEVSLPVSGAFELSTKLSKSGEVYSVSGLEGQIGSTDITGELQWEQVGGRYVLKGKLASGSIHLQDLFAESGPSSVGKADFLDQPIPLDWTAAMDGELELDVQRVLGTSVPIRNAAATAKLGNGQLMLSPLRATLAGTPVTGDLTLVSGEDPPAIRFAAKSQRLDLGDILKRNAPVRGRAENVTLTASSRGRTVRTLLQRAEFSLKTQSGRLRFAGAQAGQPFNLEIAAATVGAKAAQPIRISVDGTYRGIPLALVVDSVTLETLAIGGTQPWPLSVSLQTSPASLTATGRVKHPFQGKGFDLALEMTGKDLRKVDPLINFAMPLRGEYRFRGRFTDDDQRFRLSDVQLTVGQSDIGGWIDILGEKPRPRIIAKLTSQRFYVEDLEYAKGVKKPETRLIPEHVIPVELLLVANLDLDLGAERIQLHGRSLGDLRAKATVENGAWAFSVQVMDDRTGAQLTFKHQLDVTTHPPVNNLQLKARDLYYGQALTQAEMAEFAEGRVDVEIELAGPGATLRHFLSQADGHVEIIGGAGRIVSRELELWTSGLLRTMFSSGWRREATTQLNCIVGNIDVEKGVARTDEFLLDTAQFTIAGSGALDLGTERLDLLLSPNLRQTSLVSFANPVQVTGTLTAPRFAITKLPRLGTAATSGLLAGLVNPAFLLFALSDIGSDNGNPCVAAIEQRDLVTKDERQRGGIWQRFRSLF